MFFRRKEQVGVWAAVAFALGGVVCCSGAELPIDANAELASARRCDLPGPEMWTRPDMALRWGQQIDPKPGLNGLLYVVHEIPGLWDAVSLEVVEDGGWTVKWKPVRNRWTPAFLTTYYRSEPNPDSPADEKRFGRIVLKETKAVLSDNTFLAEVTLKNTSPLPLKCRVSVKTCGGLPAPGEPGKVWDFTTKSMGVETGRRTCAASATSFGGALSVMELPPHSEKTFRYALAISPDGADTAAARAVRAIGCADAFAANARSFNEWFAHNVPRLETSDPDLRKMYLYRWFVVKRGTHEARCAISDHEYPRRAVYESPIGGWYGCVIGLPVPVQIQEVAWMRDPGVLRDHILNWCDKVRGYRGYIQYTGMSIARSMENHPSAEFAKRVLPAVAEYAREMSGNNPSRLPVQGGSWTTGAEYQPNFYQFTEPKWDFRNDTEFVFGKKDKRFKITRLVRMDKAAYGIGNMLGAAKLADMTGDSATAAEMRKLAGAHLDIVRKRHWDDKTGFFLAADADTYRLADEAVCYDSFAPYMWGMLCEDRYLGAFDEFIDRAWFWDDFPGSTCAKTCPMYSGSNSICTPPASVPSPHIYGCSWNGPMWHYANTLFAEAFGQCAIRRSDMRGKWVEFFDAWSESHFACGDRTMPVAGEHFRPEDGAYCGSAWDYFHSSWLDPFFRYYCGIRLSDDGKNILFEPFTSDDFRLTNVPIGGRELSFEQRREGGVRRLEVRDSRGRLLASGMGRDSVCCYPVAKGQPWCAKQSSAELAK